MRTVLIMLGIVAVLIVAMCAGLFLVGRSSRTAPKSYGDFRQQIITDARKSKPSRGNPPPRPVGLDTRLPASHAAELRRLCPPTAETRDAFYDCYDRVFSSVHQELAAIDKETEWMELLSPARRAIVVVSDLDGEVNNGGFDQYYLNSTGDWAAFGPEAFRLLGQEQVAAMTDRANAQFPGPAGPSKDRSQRLQQMGRMGEKARATWDSIDLEYYDYTYPQDDVDIGVIVPFILEHKNEFFLPE